MSNKPKSSSNNNNRAQATGYEPVGTPTTAARSRKTKGRKRSNSTPSVSTDEESEAGSSRSDSESKEPTDVDDSDSTTVTPSNGKLETKSGFESLVKSLKSSLNRPTSKNGLYGDTSVSMTLPRMPVLVGPSASQYSDCVTGRSGGTSWAKGKLGKMKSDLGNRTRIGTREDLCIGPT